MTHLCSQQIAYYIHILKLIWIRISRFPLVFKHKFNLRTWKQSSHSFLGNQNILQAFKKWFTITTPILLLRSRCCKRPRIQIYIQSVNIKIKCMVSEIRPWLHKMCPRRWKAIILEETHHIFFLNFHKKYFDYSVKRNMYSYIGGKLVQCQVCFIIPIAFYCWPACLLLAFFNHSQNSDVLHKKRKFYL